MMFSSIMVLCFVVDSLPDGASDEGPPTGSIGGAALKSRYEENCSPST